MRWFSKLCIKFTPARISARIGRLRTSSLDPASLEDAPEMYQKFRDKQDGVIKVVLRP